jgi:hypothetical protein
MSIFRLFKSAVVLSIVLYFEGCGGGDKKNKTNQPSVEDVDGNVVDKVSSSVEIGEPSAAATPVSTGHDDVVKNDKITKIKADIDVQVDELLKEIKLTDLEDINVLKTAADNMKKEIDSRASTGKDLVEDDVEKILKNLILKPEVMKIAIKSGFLAVIELSAGDPIYAKTSKIFGDAISRAVDNYIANGNTITENSMDVLLHFARDELVEELVKMQNIPASNVSAINAMRIKIRDELKDAGEDGQKDIFQKYLRSGTIIA